MVSPVLLILVPIAGWAGYKAGGALVRRVLREGITGIPPWLEALLPLRGRWLHLLIIGPIALVIAVITFFGVLGAVMLR